MASIKESLKELWEEILSLRPVFLFVTLGITIPIIVLFIWCFVTFDNGAAIAVVIILLIIDSVLLYSFFRQLRLKDVKQSSDEDKIGFDSIGPKR